jgi:hypothetical protein
MLVRWADARVNAADFMVKGVVIENGPASRGGELLSEIDPRSTPSIRGLDRYPEWVGKLKNT